MAAGLETEAPEPRTAPTSEPAYLAISAFLFIASVGATIYFSQGSMSGGMSMPGQPWFTAAVSFMGIWIVMMAAMMLPSLVPTLSRYRRSAHVLDKTRLAGLTVLAGGGYFLVWAGFGTAAYALGLLVPAAEMQWMDLARLVPFATALVLLLTGCFQMTEWKTHQLECCRETPDLSQPQSSGSGGAWQYGLRLGLHCCLCCSGFMLILLVTGMMNLAGMALVAAAITIERLAPRPVLVARALGILLIFAGALGIAQVLGVV